MTADIGYRRKNPFSDPNALITKEEAELYPRATSLAGISVIGEEANPEQAPKELTGVARIMSEQFETLMGGQFSELADHMDFGGSQPSKPANTSKQNNDPNKADTAKPGKTKGSHGDVR